MLVLLILAVVGGTAFLVYVLPCTLVLVWQIRREQAGIKDAALNAERYATIAATNALDAANICRMLITQHPEVKGIIEIQRVSSAGGSFLPQ